MRKIKIENFDKFLLGSLALVLLLHYSKIIPGNIADSLLAFFASVAALPVLASAYSSLRQKKITVDLLASIALVVSILNREWSSAVFINLMLTSARLFSAYTEDRSRQAIKSLLKLRPEKVKVKKGKKITEISVSKIKKGDLIVIELGDRIPVDGIVISGQALIDQSSLTGESAPVHKEIGGTVLSSTLNTSGSMVIKAQKVGKDTAFEKIIRLVEESQNEKVGIQTTADQFASWYITLTLLAAITIYLFSRDSRLVLAVLLVTCADDIAVAIPLAFSAAIGKAARRGIIIKGGAYLEGLTKVKTLILDKTGTITRGQLAVEKIIPLEKKYSPNDILRLSAMAEYFSQHPVAKAIISCADQKKIVYEKSTNFQEYSGKGSTAFFRGKQIACGKTRFLEELGIKIDAEKIKMIERTRRDGLSSLLLVSYNKKLIGIIALSDEIRPETKKAVARLKALGVKEMIMLTGDNEEVARRVAHKIGIGKFHANLLPENKLEYVRKYLNKKSKVAMVGDGVNDAAALVLADIGIAMGAIGTDTAIEAADVALMEDDLSKIPEAIQIGQTVTRIARQDFWIWGTINALGLFLVFSKFIGPEGAAGFNFITDFFPILNSLRLFVKK
jgi:heavy metal translocating P-type ATPase